jgi:hypothetical protein
MGKSTFSFEHHTIQIPYCKISPSLFFVWESIEVIEARLGQLFVWEFIELGQLFVWEFIELFVWEFIELSMRWNLFLLI